MSKKMSFLGMMLIALCFVGCTKPNADDNTNVEVKTYTPTNITSTSASCGGDAIVNGNVSLSELGVCWSTSSNPTPSDNKQSTEVCDQPYVCTINGLTPDTKYYVRAFAYDGTNYYYGENQSFTTETSGGGGGTNYETMLPGGWNMHSPTYDELYMNIIFDYDDVKGKIFFEYSNNFSGVMAFGDYTISGNIVTATYTNVSFSDFDIVPWVYGHTYGFVDGQTKTVTYTIQSCTSNNLVLKESVYGDTLELERYF